MTTSDGLIRKTKSLRNAFKKAKENGVKIRIAAPLTKENKDSLKVLSQFAEVKDTKFNTRFCIIDNQDLVFMILDDKEVHKSYDTSVWVNTKFFSNTLKNMFEDEWQRIR